MSQLNRDRNDWIGFTVNNIEVIDKIKEEPKNFKNRIYKQDILLVKCKLCDRKYEIQASHLIKNKPKTCGKCGIHKKNVIGLRQGKLSILEEFITKNKNNKNESIWVKCQCDCGNQYTILKRSFLVRKISDCNKCRKYDKYKSCLKNLNIYFSKIKSRALKNNVDFTITKDLLNDLIIKQNYKCKLSNKSIKLDDGSASLDRIDSSKGYIEGNVQWVHKIVNFMKQELSQEIFLDFCKCVAENNLA